MNGRRRGTREESRKQALDSAWSMEMSKLTRDGIAKPVSRAQILRRERGQRIIHFACSAAEHEQDWQPCPVVIAIHTSIALHCCCCFSHSAHWLPTRKKLLYTVANPARGLLNREKKKKKKSGSAPPPPPCALLVRRKNKNNRIKN